MRSSGNGRIRTWENELSPAATAPKILALLRIRQVRLAVVSTEKKTMPVRRDVTYLLDFRQERLAITLHHKEM